MRALQEKLSASFARLGLRGARLLLAVSGGADSVALLYGARAIAADYSLGLEVGTVDHRLRDGSAEDADHVEQLCASLGLPCHRRALTLPKGENVEAAARRERYLALEQMAAPGALIATAHTLDDQAETVLLRLGRGCGLRGLGAIHEQRGRLVRPMLEVTRSEVEAYLDALGVEAREDPTNRSMAFARNRVRALVMPALREALGPSAPAALARVARAAREDEALLERQAAAEYRRASVAPLLGFSKREGGRSLEFSASLLAKLEPALLARVLAMATRELGLSLSYDNLSKLCALVRSPSPRALSFSGGEARARYGRLAITAGGMGATRASPSPVASQIELWGPGDYVLGGGERLVITEVRRGAKPGEASIPECSEGARLLLPSKGVRWPLLLRHREPGDRFRPWGGGEKRLKEWLIDRKLPREERGALWLLVEKGEGGAWSRVLWVLGQAPGVAKVAPDGERLELRLLRERAADGTAEEVGHLRS